MYKTVRKISAMILLTLVLGGCRQDDGLESGNHEASSGSAVETSGEEMDAGQTPNPIRYTLSDDGVLDVMGDGEVPAELFPFTTDEGDEGNYDVQKIVVHEGITGLGKKCFANFYSADAVVLPEGLKKIGAYAFDCCEYLKQIRLPDTVEEIGAYAFRDCVSLQELTLPPSLERYPVNAIKRCSALKKVKNCSSRTWKLCSGKSLHGTWYGGGSKVDSIKPGQTVKLISDEYKITYDLNGGVAKEKLPETYSYFCRYGDALSVKRTDKQDRNVCGISKKYLLVLTGHEHEPVMNMNQSVKCVI